DRLGNDHPESARAMAWRAVPRRRRDPGGQADHAGGRLRRPVLGRRACGPGVPRPRPPWLSTRWMDRGGQRAARADAADRESRRAEHDPARVPVEPCARGCDVHGAHVDPGDRTSRPSGGGEARRAGGAARGDPADGRRRGRDPLARGQHWLDGAEGRQSAALRRGAARPLEARRATGGRSATLGDRARARPGTTGDRLKAFVTGASGFLGHALCAELGSRGQEAAVLVRRPGSEPEGTDAVHGDLSDAATLTSAFEQIRPDCVIHLAAEIATQRNAGKIDEVNVEGTRRLLSACTSVGGMRFMFISMVVTGDAGGDVLDETSTLPVETAYGRSKQEGEQLVRESRLPSIIIRPSHVYGPGGWYAEEIVKRLRQPGRMVVLGRGHNWWDVVRVEDVATACVTAAERAPDGALYHVVDDRPIRYYEFVALTAQALGVAPPRHVPIWLARLVAGGDPVRAVTRSARSSNARIKSELDWEPRYPAAQEGGADAVARLAGGASA